MDRIRDPEGRLSKWFSNMPDCTACSLCHLDFSAQCVSDCVSPDDPGTGVARSAFRKIVKRSLESDDLYCTQVHPSPPCVFKIQVYLLRMSSVACAGLCLGFHYSRLSKFRHGSLSAGYTGHTFPLTDQISWIKVSELKYTFYRGKQT